MSHKDVYECLSEVVECAHMAYPPGEAPSLPWAVYYLEEGRGSYADNRRFGEVNSWVVELYTKTHSEALERAIADAIENNNLFGSYEITEAWVESEQCLQTTFRFAEVN